MIDSRVPHIYHDTVYSKKLFEISEKKHEKIRGLFFRIEEFHDIEKTKGALLDLLGGNFKVARLSRTDEEYRKILKFEISTLQFMGSPEEIIKILSEYYDLPLDNFSLTELSAKIIIKIPKDIDKEDIFRKVRRLKSAGIGLQIVFEIYVEDYTLAELEEMTLIDIEKITLARR